MAVLMTLLLAMQYVVSVKAGLVNHVQGTANVAPMDMARLERPIRTGSDGYLEILLTPGAFLRVAENSEVVFESVDLSDVRLRVVNGPAVVEVVDISKNSPITVKTGDLTTRIIHSGVFRFEDGTATVLHGKLQTADQKLEYEKGWQIFYQDNYRARKKPDMQLTSLDVYSDSRSAEIARANMSLVSTLRSPRDQSFWLMSPYYGWYTFIPRDNFRSPYGYRYYSVGEYSSGGRAVNNSALNSGGSSGGTPTSNTSGNSNSNSNSDSAGGGGAPAVTVTAPTGERTSPAGYIEGKNSPTGATQ